jgi:hypothetical protein
MIWAGHAGNGAQGAGLETGTYEQRPGCPLSCRVSDGRTKRDRLNAESIIPNPVARVEPDGSWPALSEHDATALDRAILERWCST